MIDNTELLVKGNVVIITAHKKMPIIDQVATIAWVTPAAPTVMINHGFYKTKWKYIKGALITPAWLAKLGFILNGDYYQHPSECTVFAFDSKNWGFNNDYESLKPICAIQYVHQLQNLVQAITGEPLTLITSKDTQ